MTRRSTDNPSSKPSERSPIDTTNGNYISGATTFNAGNPVDACPLRTGESGRLDWLNGWYGERTDKWIREFDERWAAKYKKSKRALFDGRKG